MMAREMKDSGIEWIGEIPAAWDIDRLKWHLNEINVQNSPIQSEKILSLTIEAGVIPYEDKGNQGNKAKEKLDGYKLAYPGTLVVNSMNVIIGAVGISKYFGCVSPVYYVFRTTENTDLRYIYYLFTNVGFQKEMRKYAKGILEIRLRISTNDLLKLRIPNPSYQMQCLISNALDKKCAEIDAIIAKTRATIEEYKKLKQAIITAAVTKGIRSSRPMKDSDIEWIGEIPTEWEIKKLRYFGNCQNGISKGEECFGMGYPFISYSDVYKNMILPETAGGLIQSTAEERNKYSVEYRDIFFTRTSETIEEVGFTSVCLKTIENAVFAGFIIRVRPYDDTLNPNFSKYFFRSDIHRRFFVKEMNLVTRASLGQELLKRLPVLVPPFAEQQEIADYLDQKCTEIDALISKKTALVEELENYKKSVIYEYVTGKKAVASIEKAATVRYPYFPATLATTKLRFAQAILLSKILDSNVKHMGRVKLEKMLFTIEHHLGFDFDTAYRREAAGPLDGSIYKCEGIISKANRWFYVKESSHGVSYTPRKDMGKYKKYYHDYFSDYDEEIERIISIFRDYSLDQAEVVATLYGAWNDLIIDKKPFTDDDIVDQVLFHWNDSKKRFPKDMWLRAIEQMRQNKLIPKGYGKHTIVKEAASCPNPF